MSWGEHKCFNTNHKFESRYDYEPLMTELSGRMSSVMAEDVLKAATKKTYVQDVCVYCGKVVRRGKKDD